MARGREEKKAENEQVGEEEERGEAKDKRAIRFGDGWKRRG